MEIKNSLAASKYLQARAAAGPSPGQDRPLGAPHNMVQEFSQSLKAAETTAQEALLGRADPHAVVEALAQTQIAVETAVAVRDKVVEAYQDILRMPI